MSGADDAKASILNSRARYALSGDLAGGPSDVALTLIELMRSAQPIDNEVRKLLADALERGRFGKRIDEKGFSGRLLPRLVVEGLGRDGDVAEALMKRRVKLKAVRELERRRASNESGSELMIDVAKNYGFGLDWMKKAITYRNSVHEKIFRTPYSSWLDAAAGNCGLSTDELDLADPDILRLVEDSIAFLDALELGK